MDETRDFVHGAPLPNLRDAVEGWADADLAEVVHRDQSTRWRAGHPVMVEEYLALLPRLADREEVVLDLIANEILLRREAGATPDADEYRARFPLNWPAIEPLFAFHSAFATRTDERVGGDAVPVEPPQCPARIGRYLVLDTLGQGGFGTVFRGRDELLARDVAIKVPHPHRMRSPADARAFLAEAQVLARLSHPGIVPVFDFGQTDDGRCYLVSKLVPSGSLSGRLANRRPGPTEAAELVAAAAEALHHAHQNGLVHRDVKPGNILLEADGRPVVADFGLALRDEDFGRGSGFAGTPAYMSPEQARGEGHLVDARTDVYGLGVVLYELLTGRRPFQAAGATELLELVIRGDPRPPRQHDSTIPRELDRICVKATARRATDRHSTALDLAEDLRQWLAGGAATRSVAPAAAPAPAPAEPSSSGAPAPVVPRGLRSFEAEDADFFLELLPGPRGRGGLPESIRFWKARLEDTDEGRACRVGLIYGPSGGGKSSLVKAGLLPRLAGHVTAVYVEASAGDTEGRLLAGLRRQYPNLPPGLTPAEALARLRRGGERPAGGKLVLVFDQFEQWLHAHPNEPGAPLADALRQCDGARVQALLLVRDDFWMGISRFMRELEVPVQEGRNSAPADLFDPRHARKVLAAFGRAYGALPPGAPAADQERFLDSAVSGLAEGGKIVPVRLALFAEMVKGKPWTPATWKTAGGAEGVGVAFLEETFGPTAPPHHRYHQRAARAVLARLLPAPGADIKGPMRSRADLLAACAGAGRPAEFDDLLRVLDSELRLVTATDHDPDAGPPPAGDARYYQLTHDYLVPALRQWLTRKRRETRRGRAELRLEEQAAAFAARPDRRNLPTWWEWVHLRLYTRSRTWPPSQRTMMRRAARLHGTRTVFALSILVLLALGAGEYHARSESHRLRDQLLSAVTADVPGIVDEMAPYRRRLEPLLRETEADAGNDPRKRLHVALALLPSDPGQADYLYERLLDARPDELAAVRRQLAPHRERLTGPLWAELEDPHRGPERRFRAAAALAAYAPDDPRWAPVAPFVATKLASEPALALADWVSALRPAGQHLLAPLVSALADEAGGPVRRRTATDLFRAFATDTAQLEAALEATDGARGADAAKRRANLAVALILTGRGDKVWPLLVHSPDPTVRGYLIERLGPGGVPPGALEARLRIEPDVTARRALVLALGGFESGPPPAERLLRDLYATDPDPGIHSAAEWALRRWGRELLAAAAPAAGDRGWFRTPEGQTMAVVRPGRLRVRAPGAKGELQPLVIDHRYAIATKEVTAEELLRLCPEHKQHAPTGPEPGCPANSVSWYAAVEYCNRLSAAEKLPEAEWCYKPNEKGKYADGMWVARDFLKRKGYRLPTAPEWAFAAAAGAETPWPCGDLDLLPGYAWLHPTSVANSVARMWPAGRLKPNDLGLFDAFGNAAEWCQVEAEAPDGAGAFVRVRFATGAPVCGGDVNLRPLQVRTRTFPLDRKDSIFGFRPVQTLP